MAYVRSKSNTISAPLWAAEPLDADKLLNFPAQVDPAQFKDALGSVITVAAGGAALGATAIPVAAIPVDLNINTVLDFGGGKFARLTAKAAAGATSLTVAALPTALVAGDKAVYSPFGRLELPGGTLVGRTYAERAANTPFGPAVNTDDEIYIVAFERAHLWDDNRVTLVKPNTQIKENRLPDYATISADATLLGKLRAAYICVVGVN